MSRTMASIPWAMNCQIIVSGILPLLKHFILFPELTYQVAYDSYTRLTHPLPAVSHFDYPWFTPGGSDKRWLGSGEEEEEGLCWVGGLMVVAQIVGPKTYERSGDWSPLQDLDLVLGPGRQQYVSFTWNDLNAIAPWMEERITKKINGPGLGI